MLRLVLSLGRAAPYAVAALFGALVAAIVALDVAIGVVGTLELPWNTEGGAPTPPSPDAAPPGPGPTPPPPNPAPTPTPTSPGCTTLPGDLIVCE